MKLYSTDSNNSLNPITESGSFPIPGYNLEQYYSGITKWIKDGEFQFDIDEELTVQKFSELSGVDFVKVGKCVYNTRNNFPLRINNNGTVSKGNRECIKDAADEGKVVDYLPEEDMIADWKITKTEWVYVITWNNHILKIGMTSSGLAARFGSYNCGLKTNMLTGSCSTTNFVICEANYLALSKGYDVEIYAYKLPPSIATVNIGESIVEVRASVASEVETFLTEFYAKVHGRNSPLCGQKKVNV
jgi:hypothetical protein